MDHCYDLSFRDCDRLRVSDPRREYRDVATIQKMPVCQTLIAQQRERLICYRYFEHYIVQTTNDESYLKSQKKSYSGNY